MMESTLSGEAGRLRTVTTSAASILDARSPDALRIILEITCERVAPIEAFSLAVYDATTDRFELVGDPDAHPVALRGSAWENALRRGRSGPADDGSDDLIVPIVEGTRTLGGMRVTQLPERPLTHRDISVLEAVAALAASALLVLSRLAEARAAEISARRPAVLRDLVRTITGGANEALGFEEAAGVCLAAVCDTLSFPAAHAWVLSPDGEFITTGIWQLRDPESWRSLCGRIATRRFPRDAGLPGLVASHAAPLHIVDTTQDPAFTDLARSGVRGLWALPVHAGREVAAVLAFFSPRPLERDRSLDAAAAEIATPLGHVIVRDRRLAGSRIHARLLESAGLAIIGCDAEHRIIVWNRAAEALFGWRRDEAIGRIDSEVIKTRMDRDQTAEITQRLAAGQPWEGEFLVTRRDGTSLPVMISAAAVYNDEHVPAGFVGVAIDQRRYTAGEHQRRQSFAMDAVGRLAGAVAHDFNNLLTGIRGIAQLAREDVSADSPLHGDLTEIIHSADRAAALTSRLLAYGRRQVLYPRVIDPGQLIRGVESSLRAAAPGHELVLEVPADTGSVHVDPAQLERVMTDLVAFSAARMSAGGVIRLATSRVKVPDADARTRDEVPAGEWVTIDFSDSGPPLSDETLAHLFEPAAGSTGGPGSGLGLGTAYGVIRQSDGYITAGPGNGRGIRLRIWLPRVEAVPESSAVVTPSAVTAAGSETLLLVEDEATVRQLARKILVRQGYHVLEAANGVEALEVFRTHESSIQLVVTDIIMPSMGGPELVRRLRAIRPDLPVLLMSGYTDDATLRKGFSRSDEAFLEKPFSPGELAQRVRKLLDAT